MEVVRAGAAAAREHSADVVIGIGGGAVLDAAKVIAALVTNGGDPLDYAEVVGDGRPLSAPSLPVVALPTTAGTGSEVTANGVVTSTEHRVKVSLRSASMLPRVAIVDPGLTLTCPPGTTAHAGLDALVQCIEPFVSPFATPLTDGFCREGIRRAASGLRRAYHHPEDLDARTDVSLCALLSGLALANGKLGAAHGLAGPLGATWVRRTGDHRSRDGGGQRAQSHRSGRVRQQRGDRPLRRWANSSPARNRPLSPWFAETAADLGVRGLSWASPRKASMVSRAAANASAPRATRFG